jgi:hypothetical protein
MPARKGRQVNCAEIGAVHASASLIIEVLNAPFSGAVAVFDDGDIVLKRVAHQHVLEGLSGSKPLPFVRSLGGYDFLETRLADFGGTVLTGSPANFGKLIAEETEKWAKVIRTANIKPE